MNVPRPFFAQNQRGQFLGGYIIAIFLVVSLAVTVTQVMQRNRKDSSGRMHRDLALNVARVGFEEGLSYFRRQPDGVYLDAFSNTAPVSQAWTTNWMTWPDAAFLPKATDTDYYSILETGTPIGLGAQALIRTFPLNAYSTTATAVGKKNSNLWGRFVLRRQNSRNWSPGPNTYSAFTDKEAVHDITHIRGQGKPGSGNIWSVFSRAYVFSHPTDITLAAAHDNGSLLRAPKQFYNGRRLLLATASVYGELSRINFNLPTAAVFNGAQVTVNPKGSLSGQGLYSVANLTPTAAAGAGKINNGALKTAAHPSVSYVFPGLTAGSLQDIAMEIDATKVGDITVFPAKGQPGFNDKVSRTSFYYVTPGGGPGGTITFPSNNTRLMTGVGLVYIAGNLVIDKDNESEWSGVVFVNGNVSIRGPAAINGTLVATGTVTIGISTDSNQAEVTYDPDMVKSVQSFLQDFRVISSSILTSSN